MENIDQIATFNKFVQVSRETIVSLKEYENLLIKGNNQINLIGKSTIKQIWTRHFLDSAQLIDFIDKNDNKIIDLGSGAGFPGLILAILLKDRKIQTKITLFEKSFRKAEFLKKIIKNFKLNAEVKCENFYELNNKVDVDVITARAFKPLKKILHLIDEKIKNFKKIFLFLGKTGENELLRASKNWDIKYKQRVSVTSSDSIIIEIKKIRKIN